MGRLGGLGLWKRGKGVVGVGVVMRGVGGGGFVPGKIHLLVNKFRVVALKLFVDLPRLYGGAVAARCNKARARVSV